MTKCKCKCTIVFCAHNVVFFLWNKNSIQLNNFTINTDAAICVYIFSLTFSQLGNFGLEESSELPLIIKKCNVFVVLLEWLFCVFRLCNNAG